MIDINQVQRDFDNGVMLCRETIRQVIELAATKTKDAERVKFAFDEFIAKTDWVQDEQDSFSFQTLGMHRADVLRKEIETLRAAASKDGEITIGFRVVKDGSFIPAVEWAATARNQKLLENGKVVRVYAPTQEACVICGANEPRTGTCGSNDSRAMCNLAASKDSSCG